MALSTFARGLGWPASEPLETASKAIGWPFTRTTGAGGLGSDARHATAIQPAASKAMA
ncbi:MAG TPA: hypothetical protein VMR31_04945 [Myxococcota bacterium]|nr:hypothetical protein [Myxococcota bacterium]